MKRNLSIVQGLTFFVQTSKSEWFFLGDLHAFAILKLTFLQIEKVFEIHKVLENCNLKNDNNFYFRPSL